MWKMKAKVSGKYNFLYVAILNNAKSINVFRVYSSYHKCKPLIAIVHLSL